ncbi:MAG: glycosyltransferase family 1 protein [Bacteroidetes bacterium]|nr:MAG: glycosyltransferase family 1 protein [Bacteroidota bacterium]
MNIGILGTRGIPNHYGGFEQFAQYLAKGLVAKGHIVFVYNSNSHPYQESTWNGIHIIHCNDPENSIGTVGQFIYDYNCLQDARKRNFDILLQLGYTSSSIWYRFWPKKAITIVNMDGLEWKRSKYNKLTQKFLQWAESLAVRHGHVLIADSIGIRNYIQTKYQKEAVYIPYGADIPENFSDRCLADFSLQANQYYLLIARMEPENNIEMIINGYLESDHHYPLIILGNTQNKYGQFLFKKYGSSSVRFQGSIYDLAIINSLRHFSALYLHGHSVGGTNPSLLEAMACGCNIAAHDNVFNKSILGNDAAYFRSSNGVKEIINQYPDREDLLLEQQNNLQKIREEYRWDKIISEYERLFYDSIRGE